MVNINVASFFTLQVCFVWHKQTGAVFGRENLIAFCETRLISILQGTSVGSIYVNGVFI